MKITTDRATTHKVALAPEEWFTIEVAGDRVVSIDGLDAKQHTIGGNWQLTLYGNRVRKDGSFGLRARIGTWEHSRDFSDTARRALWLALPSAVRGNLATLEVTV